MFVEADYPTADGPAELHLYCSTDDGLSWQQQPTVVLPDAAGIVPTMHMSEQVSSQTAPNLLSRCTYYTPLLHLLCSHFAPIVLPICSIFAPIVLPLCF